MADLWVLRAAVLTLTTGAAWLLRPFDLGTAPSLFFGVLAGLLIVAIENRLRRAELHHLIGGAVGLCGGLAAAALVTWSIGATAGAAWGMWVQIATMLALSYLGLVIGVSQGERLNLAAFEVFGIESNGDVADKILDTSVIIDGRIADIAEAGFIDGRLVIPQFVLWELQLVADSADTLKRNRGRRGLDILQRIQKMNTLDVRIVENDYPKLKEVDQKLIELAKETDGKIITNDFNLNKLARLHGVHVLNINELANSLKAIVLPGETMNVFILKEGKEQNQGVAYLDDGTMVVVDHARRHISETIEITVTSVLQTTAGKMIFGRYEGSGGSSGQRPALRRGAAQADKPQKVEQAAGK